MHYINHVTMILRSWDSKTRGTPSYINIGEVGDRRGWEHKGPYAHRQVGKLRMLPTHAVPSKGEYQFSTQKAGSACCS